MNISIDRRGPVPIARQIQGELERLIRDRRLGPGTKLPASRELARVLGVNRETVVLAYEELVAAGWARAHVGQGTFVAERAGVAGTEAPEGDPASRGLDWSTLFSRSSQIVALGDERRRASIPPGPAGGWLISFAGGMPDSGLFPTDAFRRVLNQVVRDEGAALLQYAPVSGYRPLRQYLAGYLLRAGLEARPEEILVVNGSQQGFDLIARTLVDPGDAVAIEQPTYPRSVEVFRSFGARLVGVPWDEQGPRADILERVLERQGVKLFACQPSAHNPTGLSIEPGRRRGLLELAARQQVPIVEDGFDASLSWGPRPAVPLKAADRDGVVIYVGTFSKILFPGLRLGWIVAPRPVVERLGAAKQLADLHTSALLQAAVHRFCERRLLDRHAARVAREYGQRRRALLGALARHMPPGVTWTEPQGGFSLLVTLPGEARAVELLPRALERGVAFTPGEAFFLDGGESTLRLSFSAVEGGRIEEGIRRLAAALLDLDARPARARGGERAVVPLV